MAELKNKKKQGGRVATLKGVAEASGYSLAAVSIVLNNSKSNAGVSPEGRKKILDVARAIGYKRNLSASYLRRGQTKCIGVVLDYLDSFPYNNYFSLINEACIEHGYHAVPFPIKRQSIARGAQHWGEVHVDGVIVLDYMPPGGLEKSEEYLPSSPFVCRLTDPKIVPPRAPTVLVDYYASTRMLLSYVFSMGWKSIQIIAEDDPDRPFARFDGHLLPPCNLRAIQDEFAERGLNVPSDDMFIRTTARRPGARYDSMMKYLSNNKLEHGVCLIQDGADGISGTYAALTEMGYAIGRDVAVASLQAIPGWEYVKPASTFLWERYGEQSRLLVELAIDAIEGTRKYSSTAQFAYPVMLYRGESVPEFR